MIEGFVNENHEPIIDLILALGDRSKNFSAVIDTGFNGYISIPEKHIESSDWLFIGYEEYELASGEIVKAKTFLGGIVFDNKKTQTFIVSSPSEDILIGTRLFENKTLFIDFVEKKIIVEERSNSNNAISQ